MQKQELRQIIREEISKVISEATLINRRANPAEIKVDDYVQWAGTENDRGMRVATGTYIGKVIKILGSKNIQVEVVFPSTDEGDMYKVTKEESKRIPAVGETIKAKYSWNSGQGSGSQGSSTLTGTVTKVDIDNAKITVKNQEDKPVTASIRDLSDIVILNSK
jgi:hypothetical protein